jgi:O-antigen ligase
MFANQAEKALAILLSIGGFLTTITVITWNLNEPVNAPKLLVLGALAGGALFFVPRNRSLFTQLIEFKPLLLSSILFVFSALISILFSESSVVHGFYGVLGRNTGFLTYFCLAVILLSCSLLRSKESVDRVLDGLFYAGVANVIYFIFSQLGIELISWSNPGDRILGTFGNSNFAGAFMAIFMVLCFARIVDKNYNLKWKIALGILILISIYEVKMSDAVQGILVSGIGLAVLVYFLIRSRWDSKIILGLYSTLILIIGTLVTAGAFQKGPLSSLIYKPSLTFRGEYWNAGWQMGISHPLLGVGMDSYGIWYRRMRAPSALISPGTETTSDTAHNVFLDIFASGGFPLLISYLLLQAVVIVHIWRGLRSFKKYDLTFVTLIATWICYLAQSIISINQIGLAIWGWILSGLIIGYVRSQSDVNIGEITAPQKISQGKVRIAKKKESISLGMMVVGIFAGGAIAIPPVAADSNWRSAQISQDSAQIVSASKAWPLDAVRVMQASDLHSRSNIPITGLELARYAVEKFPNNFFAWKLLFNTPSVTDAEKAKAKLEMLRLDPLNPEFK